LGALSDIERPTSRVVSKVTSVAVEEPGFPGPLSITVPGAELSREAATSQ
jgi:hypothetical protein